MMGPRRALIFASGSRYIVTLMQVAATFIVARYVLPAQFGVIVLGGSAFLIAEALRELGSVAYLVQQKDLTREQIRTAFTVSLIVTVLVAALIVASAGAIAAFYREPELVDYLRVMAIGYALGPFVHPISALLSRNMAFDRIAVIDLVSAVFNAATAVLLVRSGFGLMAMAWANVVSGCVGALLGFWFQRDLGIFRPSMAAWRSVLSFGLHGGATALTYRLGEALLFLSLGRTMDARAVGLLQRGFLLAQIPERVLLSGAGAVTMPAFAAEMRSGRPLKPVYLHAVELISGVYLAAMLGLVLVAQPLVAVLLGPAWADVAPLTQIMAAGLILGFGASLNTLALIAAGGIRQTTPLALIQMLVLIGMTALAAPHGVEAVAWTTFVTAPISGVASVIFLRTHLPVTWRELGGSVWRSAVAAAASTLGPLTVAIGTDWRTEHPLAALGASLALAALFWTTALALLRHPLFAELVRAKQRLRPRLGPG